MDQVAPPHQPCPQAYSQVPKSFFSRSYKSVRKELLDPVWKGHGAEDQVGAQGRIVWKACLLAVLCATLRSLMDAK
jgi:hypothetical protein